MGILRCQVLALCACAALLSGCGFSSRYYLAGEGNSRGELDQMLRNLSDEQSTPEQRFVYMQEISKALRQHHEIGRLNLLLSDYVEKHKKDPYDAYYLYVVADNYASSNAIPFAAAYYDRILADYPDLLVHGTSIHYLCLTQLIKLVSDPEQRVAYYKQLIARFTDKIQNGPTYYNLAKTYAALGEWDLEMQAYKNFLSSSNRSVPGVPNAAREVTTLINYYDFPKKSWATASLSDLVTNVRYAIQTRNVRALAAYRAKVGFFARSWESESLPVDQQFLNDFDVFMNPQVYASSTLDVDSNSKEAYLKTAGWSYRIETWYLYFRKVNFPEDPDVQGKWEWAGIYFGEKPFSGADRS